MGFTGEFVRSVFSRNRSTDHHHHHPQNKVRSNNNGVEKRRWVSVKSYLCGDHDELDSVLAAEDSASVNRSEETVMQPIQEDWLSREETKSEEETVTENNDRKNSNFKLLSEEEAAILIQAAYRGFLYRRQNEGIRKKITGEDEEEKNLVMASPDTKSMGSSIEVQTGNSIEVYPLEGEKISVYHHRSQHRARAQVLKQKDDWDDSTVSSYVSKMRVQNRMEATTRRERALAYAFSQQLRICSKRTPNKYNSNAEPNMSWSWLERWMATRLPDSASVESHDHRFAVRKRFLDVACREEKESCGSNEVSLHQFDKCSSTSQEVVVKDHDHDFINPPAATKAKNNLKARTGRTVSRRKTVPSYQFPEAHFKVSKREGSSTVRKDNRQKEKQMGFKRIEMKPNSPMKS